MNQKHALWTGLCLLLVSAEAVAQDAASSDQPQTAEAKAPAAEKKAPLAAVVRGLYVDTHVGGGFMLVNADVEPDAFNPGVSGSEELGSGTVFGVSVGYDITDAVALQLLTGAVMVSGGRSDKVRDLSLLYGGLGGRFGVPLSERLLVTLGLGAVYTGATNAVEGGETGLGVHGSAGIEYFVHIRHFSVGLQLAGLAPLSPSRMFLSLSPTLKYTF